MDEMEHKPTILDETVSTPVSTELRNEIASLAASESRKVAQMARILLMEAVKARRALQPSDSRKASVA